MAIENDEIFLVDQPRQFGIEFQRFQDLLRGSLDHMITQYTIP
jgi:hypothetical protein